jgi:hypothetical protein
VTDGRCVTEAILALGELRTALPMLSLHLEWWLRRCAPSVAPLKRPTRLACTCPPHRPPLPSTWKHQRTLLHRMASGFCMRIKCVARTGQACVHDLPGTNAAALEEYLGRLPDCGAAASLWHRAPRPRQVYVVAPTTLLSRAAPPENRGRCAPPTLICIYISSPARPHRPCPSRTPSFPQASGQVLLEPRACGDVRARVHGGDAGAG